MRLMINGILKDKNENEMQNYISARNIEINGTNLEDYLEKLKMNLLEYVVDAINPFFVANGYDITNVEANANNYIRFRNIRTNSDIFSVNEDGNEVTINEQLPVSNCFAFCCMFNEFGNNSVGGSIVDKIEIKDNNNNDVGTPSTCTQYFESGKRNNAMTFIPIQLAKGYKIRFKCETATAGSYFYRNNIAIIIFNNINENMFNFPI